MRKTIHAFLWGGLLLSTAAVLFCSVGAFAQPDEMQPLDIKQILSEAADYRHRAAVLRKLIGVREQKITSMQQQANELIAQSQADAQAQAQAAQQAQANAQSDNAGLNVVASLVGNLIPGGNSLAGQAVQGGLTGMGSAEVNQANSQAQNAQAQGTAEVSEAQKDVDSLTAQAQTFQGEKKKLAYKTKQYEQLADAKDLLAAAEILRLQARKQADSAGEADGAAATQKKFVQEMDIW
ncbi:MAG TPA: hypothetical protein VNK24_08535 [Elusimicrobiota bacterium]|nr:hypothetical protein [Elusimicrobiota bacterium]